MSRTVLCIVLTVAITTLALLTFVPPAEAEPVPFDSTRWNLARAAVVEHLGRDALKGAATLKDVSLQNGIIAVDIAVTGARSYPGFRFRMQEGAWEEAYVRPHRMGLYEDGVQYTPAFGGVACWQLYNGPDWTAAADIPNDEWVHLEVWLKDQQALVFLGDMDTPVLVVPQMVIDPIAGGIALNGPADESAFFSNFNYTITDDLDFPPLPPKFAQPGLVMDWSVSQAIPYGNVDLNTHHSEQIPELIWQPVTADIDGLVNITRYVRPAFRGVSTVWARTTLHAAQAGQHKYNIAYSDWATLFVNGEPVFEGHSAYRERDSGFLGVAGFFDAVYLPLRRGENTIELVVSEAAGGSGFGLQDGEAMFFADGVKELWATDRVFGYPESVAYDPERHCLYVSNYFLGGQESISRVSMDGEVIDIVFIAGLRLPAGITVHDGFLWTVSGAGLVKMDPDERSIVESWIAPNAGLNDICFDGDGTAYITDSPGDRVLKWSSGEFQDWYTGTPLDSPNGLFIRNGVLWVGNFNGGELVGLSLDDASLVQTIPLPGDAKLDGLALDRDGNLIVSGYEGRVFRVNPDAGDVELILDRSLYVFQAADLTTIPERGLMLVPSYMENRVVAFEID